MPKSPYSIDDLQAELAACLTGPTTTTSIREYEDLSLMLAARTSEPNDPAADPNALAKATNRQAQRRFRRRNGQPVGTRNYPDVQSGRQAAVKGVVRVGMAVVAPDGRPATVLATGKVATIQFDDGALSGVLEKDLLVPTTGPTGPQTAGPDTEALLRASVVISAYARHLAALDGLVAGTVGEGEYNAAREALDVALRARV